MRIGTYLVVALAMVLPAGGGCGGSGGTPEAGTFGDTGSEQGADGDSDGGADAPLDKPMKEVRPDTLPDAPPSCGIDLRLTDATSNRSRPSLLWTGDKWGLTWEDYRIGNWEIFFSELDGMGGKLLDDQQISATAKPSNYPSLAWNGSLFALIWSDEVSGKGDLVFSQVNPESGKGKGEVDAVKNDARSNRPSMVPRAGGWAVAWENDDVAMPNFEIWFALLDEGGNVLGDLKKVTDAAGNSFAPSLHALDDGYVVVFHDERSGDAQIYAAKLDKDGNKVGMEKQVTMGTPPSAFPASAVTASQIAIAYARGQELFVTLLRASDLAFDAAPRSYSDKGLISNAPSIAWNGTNFGLAYHAAPEGSANSDVHFTELDDAGDPVGTETVIDDPKNSFLPSVSWSGSKWGLAWEDDRDGHKEIYFRCVDPAM